MHGLGGIAETRLEVFPDVNWIRRDPGTGGNREDPGALEEKNTVSETTIASDTGMERIFAGHTKITGDTIGAMGLRDGISGQTKGQLGTGVVIVDVGGS